ncbi:MAG: DJ-1/PfpI family protein [Rikenellaceae bacterium]|nr:DJ-1/PfpI family protein [Rikenellaceae bacterium]
MAKKAAVLALNPVNGSGLFQYLEAFYENGIGYRVFAVAETTDISTNSGIALKADDTVANLVGKENDYDALVFACGDAIPVFSNNADKQYNRDMLSVIGAFAKASKIMVGHCAAALMYEMAGVSEGRKLAVHPLAKGAISKGEATDTPAEVDGNFYTARTENSIPAIIGQVVEALKD